MKKWMKSFKGWICEDSGLVIINAIALFLVAFIVLVASALLVWFPGR
jgi:hypothetical protein